MYFKNPYVVGSGAAERMLYCHPLVIYLSVFTRNTPNMKKNKRPVWLTGQHFTIDTTLIVNAITLANITENDTVLDIGAGTGLFTAPLAVQCKRVIAIENDEALLKILRKRFANYPRVTIVAADIKKYRLSKTSFKVVSNIPYRITSDIVKQLLFTNLEYCTGGVLLLQLQVAQKLVATRQSNPYKVFYRTFFDMRLRYKVPPSSFLPPSGVTSALLQFKRNRTTLPGELKVKYLCFLRHLLQNPELSVKTALKQLFRKRQIRHLSAKYNIPLQQQLASLQPRQWWWCFLELLENVPEKFHPKA